MKTTAFGLYYLGGRVDLLRLREHLVSLYPEATLITHRQKKILYVPIATGEIPGAADGSPVAFEIVNHQFESGHGLALLTFRPKPGTGGPGFEAFDLILGAAPVMGPVMDYLKHALAVERIADIYSVRHTEASRQKLKTQTGIRLNYVGLDGLSMGFILSRTGLMIGTDLTGVDTNKAVDLCSDDQGLLFAFGRQRLWAPVLTEKVRWDLITLQLRELGAKYLTSDAMSWLDDIQLQLAQMRQTLDEENQTVWTQERKDVERADVHFHLFSGEARQFLARSEAPSLEIVDQERWDRISRFNRFRQTINESLEEAHRAIERMTRPLDFREFRLLKTGVEIVEGRIMLLTVLLVMMELFTLAIEPGHLTTKGVLLALVILIPAGFILFERWRRKDVVERGRRLLLRNRIERARTEVAGLERDIELTRTEEFFAEETRDAYVGEQTVALDRLKQRLADLESELRRQRIEDV